MPTNPGPDHDEGPVPGVTQAARGIERQARRARLRRGLLASVFTVAGLTVAGEVWLRATSWRQRHFESTINKTYRHWVELTTAGIFEERTDPVRRYAMRPGASCRVGSWTFRVSRHGTRGEDFPAEKPPGEKRLLCLGDSFAFGLWCDEDETLVGQLARRANEAEDARGSGTVWRPVNLGVPGYHAGQQLRALEQDGLALDPDVVVLFFNTNDIEQEGFFYDEELGVLRRDFLPLPTRLRAALWSSHLYGWIASRHRRHVESGPVPPHMDPRVPWSFVREDNQAATRSAIARMEALCRAAGVPFFFVNMPQLTWQGELQDPAWSMLPLVEWAQGVADDLGLPSVSLLGLFRGYADGVDRLAEGAPPDFFLDLYGSDPAIRALVDWAAAEAERDGEAWSELTDRERAAYAMRYPVELPTGPDFHLTGEGYGHIARVVYPALRAAGLLP